MIAGYPSAEGAPLQAAAAAPVAAAGAAAVAIAQPAPVPPLLLGRLRGSERYVEVLHGRIGEGGYGDVFKARDTNSNQIVAIKKAKVKNNEVEMGGVSFTALREIKLMQAVRHPNIMGYLDVYAKEGGEMHLVMELMDGDLKSFLEESNRNGNNAVFQDQHVKCITNQVLQGVDALHARFFVHRDVKPANMLVCYQTGIIKLTDFGTCRTIGHGDRPFSSRCTTLSYMAPELFFGARYYGQAIDLWAVGCVVAELFSQKTLFDKENEMQLIQQIQERRGSPTEDSWPGVESLPMIWFIGQHVVDQMRELERAIPRAAPDTLQFVDALLSMDPKKRPTAEQAVLLLEDAFTGPCKPDALPFPKMQG